MEELCGGSNEKFLALLIWNRRLREGERERERGRERGGERGYGQSTSHEREAAVLPDVEQLTRTDTG